MNGRNRGARGTRRALAHCLLVALVALLAGCGKQRWWRVFQQASPNPMLRHHEFYLAPFAFDGINIEGRSEAEFMTGPPDLVAGYVDGKVRMVSNFAGFMARSHYHVQPLEAAAAPPGTFVIRPHITYLRFLQRPIGRAGVGQSNGSALVHVQIFTHDGVLLDDVRFTATEEGAHRVRNVAGQMEDMGESLGSLLVKYLETRTGD